MARRSSPSCNLRHKTLLYLRCCMCRSPEGRSDSFQLCYHFWPPAMQRRIKFRGRLSFYLYDCLSVRGWGQVFVMVIGSLDSDYQWQEWRPQHSSGNTALIVTFLIKLGVESCFRPKMTSGMSSSSCPLPRNLLVLASFEIFNWHWPPTRMASSKSGNCTVALWSQKFITAILFALKTRY